MKGIALPTSKTRVSRRKKPQIVQLTEVLTELAAADPAVADALTGLGLIPSPASGYQVPAEPAAPTALTLPRHTAYLFPVGHGR